MVAAPEGVSGAGALGLGGDALELTLAALLGELAEWLPAPVADVGAALSERDALLGQPVSWSGGSGVEDGIEQDGSLRVRVDSGAIVLLESGEVHLAAEDRAPKGG